MESEASTRPPKDEAPGRPEQPAKHAIIRFAAFELRTETRELYKQGTRIRLQIKPFQVLETLLDKPGELVTREELRNRLWPSGTFVDFESGLNTAINRLRSALGDSADEPRYIETLPRLGYRFIAPVQPMEPETAKETPPATVPEPAVSTSEPVHVAYEASAPPMLVASAPKSRNLPLWIASGCLSVAAILLGAFYARAYFDPMPDFRLVNFRGADIFSARFVSNSTVVYSARLGGKWQTLVSELDGSNNRTLPLSGVVFSVSDRGDLAVMPADEHEKGPSSLKHASLAGGPETLLDAGVTAADWVPGGKELALIRQQGSDQFVEFPKGNVVYRSEGWLNCIRVSHDGKQVAFLEHPVHDDDAGHVRIADRSGATRVLSHEWASTNGLAWGPLDREVWFTAAHEGLSRSLYSVSLSGRLRKLSKQPLPLRLLDVSPNGHALVAADESRMTVRTAVAGQESDISQFDYTDVDDMSHDGHMLLLTESGDAGGLHYASFVYDLNSHNAKRFGSGRGLALSPDKTEALTVDPQDWTALTITCLISGRGTRVPGRGFRYQWARFLDRGQLLVGGSYANQPLEMAYQNIHTGQIVPIPGAPYLDHVTISPDGSKVAGLSSGATEIFDLNTKSIERVEESETRPITWSDDGSTLFLLTHSSSAYSLVAYNLANHRCAPWKTLELHDPAAFAGVAGVAAAPATDVVAYSAHLTLSRLYLVDGLL